MNSVLEALKSKKQKLYEKHILDSEGRIRLYSPVVQSILLKVLENNGLEKAVEEVEKALQKEKEARV